jgi:hypothetical protein
MQTEEIIQEIQSLPLSKKIHVVKETLKFIKKEEKRRQLEMAVNELSEDYSTDKELTAFTSLDFENFYETK